MSFIKNHPVQFLYDANLSAQLDALRLSPGPFPEESKTLSWTIGISERGILEHPADMPNRCDHGTALLQDCDDCEDKEPAHAAGCICHDCAEADLTAEND